MFYLDEEETLNFSPKTTPAGGACFFEITHTHQNFTSLILEDIVVENGEVHLFSHDYQDREYSTYLGLLQDFQQKDENSERFLNSLNSEKAQSLNFERIDIQFEPGDYLVFLVVADKELDATVRYLRSLS